MKGRVHSFQSLGAVDGPGLRFVVFLQGCPLRCSYCHNPDTWDTAGGTEYSVEEVIEKILRYKPYFAENGGVTISGGEPLLQWQFVSELVRCLKENGISTSLDTSGIGSKKGASKILRHTDLVICDLKFSNDREYLCYTKASLSAVIEFLKLTEKLGVPLWIRHVVIPELTAKIEYIMDIAAIASQFSNIRKLELLPFKKLCTLKYQEMGLNFPFKDFDECSDSVIKSMYAHIQTSITS